MPGMHPRVTREGKLPRSLSCSVPLDISCFLWLPKTFFSAGISGWERPVGLARGGGLRCAMVPLLERLTFQLEDVLCIQEALFPPAVRFHLFREVLLQTPSGQG